MGAPHYAGKARGKLSLREKKALQQQRKKARSKRAISAVWVPYGGPKVRELSCFVNSNV